MLGPGIGYAKGLPMSSALKFKKSREPTLAVRPQLALSMVTENAENSLKKPFI